MGCVQSQERQDRALAPETSACPASIPLQKTSILRHSTVLLGNEMNGQNAPVAGSKCEKVVDANNGLGHVKKIVGDPELARDARVYEGQSARHARVAEEAPEEFAIPARGNETMTTEEDASPEATVLASRPVKRKGTPWAGKSTSGLVPQPE